MSRYVDLRKPISDEDRAYLMSRSREGDVAVNDRMFKDRPEDEVAARVSQANQDDEDEIEDAELVQDQADLDFVNSLKTGELRVQLEARGLDKTGSKADLMQRLLAALAAEDAEDDEDGDETEDDESEGE